MLRGGKESKEKIKSDGDHITGTTLLSIQVFCLLILQQLSVSYQPE